MDSKQQQLTLSELQDLVVQSGRLVDSLFHIIDGEQCRFWNTRPGTSGNYGSADGPLSMMRPEPLGRTGATESKDWSPSFLQVRIDGNEI